MRIQNTYLQIEPKEVKELLGLYAFYRSAVESQIPVEESSWKKMKQLMERVLKRSCDDWQQHIASSESISWILIHENLQVLNLPWLEVNPGLDFPLVYYTHIQWSFSIKKTGCSRFAKTSFSANSNIASDRFPFGSCG